MTVSNEEVSAAILEMRDLLRLLAAPAVAERDKISREEIRRIIGSSADRKRVALLMDGSRTQADIHNETRFHKGNLSTLVKTLNEAGLLKEDVKRPQLKIYVPPDFFEKTT